MSPTRGADKKLTTTDFQPKVGMSHVAYATQQVRLVRRRKSLIQVLTRETRMNVEWMGTATEIIQKQLQLAQSRMSSIEQMLSTFINRADTLLVSVHVGEQDDRLRVLLSQNVEQRARIVQQIIHDREEPENFEVEDENPNIGPIRYQSQ